MELLTILNESRGEKSRKICVLGAFGKHRVFNAIPLSMLGFWGLFFRPFFCDFGPQMVELGSLREPKWPQNDSFWMLLFYFFMDFVSPPTEYCYFNGFTASRGPEKRAPEMSPS